MLLISYRSTLPETLGFDLGSIRISIYSPCIVMVHVRGARPLSSFDMLLAHHLGLANQHPSLPLPYGCSLGASRSASLGGDDGLPCASHPHDAICSFGMVK